MEADYIPNSSLVLIHVSNLLPAINQIFIEHYTLTMLLDVMSRLPQYLRNFFLSLNANFPSDNIDTIIGM